MSSEMCEGIRPADDGLHLEHVLDDVGIAGWRRKLREDPACTYVSNGTFRIVIRFPSRMPTRIVGGAAGLDDGSVARVVGAEQLMSHAGAAMRTAKRHADLFMYALSAQPRYKLSAPQPQPWRPQS